MDEDIIRLMSSDEFNDSVRELAVELRAGADISPEETARRLGLPFPLFMTMVAAWGAMRTGEAVMFVPEVPKEETN